MLGSNYFSLMLLKLKETIYKDRSKIRLNRRNTFLKASTKTNLTADNEKSQKTVIYYLHHVCKKEYLTEKVCEINRAEEKIKRKI